MAPRLFALTLGEKSFVDFRSELLRGQIREVKSALLSIAEPYRNWRRPLLCEQLGQSDDDRSFPRSHTADQNPGPPVVTVAQIVDHYLTKLLAPDHVTDDAARGGNQL